MKARSLHHPEQIAWCRPGTRSTCAWPSGPLYEDLTQWAMAIHQQVTPWVDTNRAMCFDVANGRLPPLVVADNVTRVFVQTLVESNS